MVDLSDSSQALIRTILMEDELDKVSRISRFFSRVFLSLVVTGFVGFRWQSSS